MPEPVRPESGGDRLRRALVGRPGRGQVVVGLLLGVLGLAAVVQLRANESGDAYVGARQSDLISLITQLELASQRARTEIATLERTRAGLQSDTDARRTALRRARQQATDLGILAGAVPVSGPGIRVEVADPSGGVGSSELLDGIEELRDARAEAISINGQVRVVAQSFLRDDPRGGVDVDGVQLAPPYSIVAIGDPHTLATALRFTDGFTDLVAQVQGRVRIEESDQVEVTAVRDPDSG